MKVNQVVGGSYVKCADTAPPWALYEVLLCVPGRLAASRGGEEQCRRRCGKNAHGTEPGSVAALLLAAKQALSTIHSRHGLLSLY